MNVIRFPDNEKCKKVHAYLDSYLSNELLVETTHDVIQHLENCKECQSTLASRQKVRDGLRRVVLAKTASTGLETKIRAQLREKASEGNRHFWFLSPWVLAAACLVLAVIGWSVVSKQTQNKNVALAVLALGLEDHITCAMGGHYPPVPPSLAIVEGEDNMGTQYAQLVPKVMQQLNEFQFVEGHRCDVGGRTYPHVILRQGGALVSLSLLEKREGESFPKGMLNGSTEIDGFKVFQGRQESYSVAGFETTKHFVFVSSGFDEQKNLDLARRLLQPTASVLKPMEASLRKPAAMVLAWLANGRFLPEDSSHR